MSRDGLDNNCGRVGCEQMIGHVHPKQGIFVWVHVSFSPRYARNTGKYRKTQGRSQYDNHRISWHSESCMQAQANGSAGGFGAHNERKETKQSHEMKTSV